MKIADRLERHLLRMAHVLCLVALVAAVAAMTALMFALAAPGQAGVVADPPVTATDVLASIPDSETANDAISTDSANDSTPATRIQAAAGLVIPAPLRQILSGDNASQPLLDAWLGSVPPSDRQQFINELSGVVARADQHAAAWEWDDRERYVAAAMNQYARIKIGRIASAENTIEVARNRIGQFRTSLGTLLAVAGFLTLLLVLMSIERNTRHLRVER